MTTDRYAQHVRDLCQAFGVRLDIDPKKAPDAAGAGYVKHTGQPVISVAPITDETTYIVAMHELGHLLSPMGSLKSEMSETMQTTHRLSTLRDVHLQLLEEESAWDWARHYALEWTPVMARVKAMTYQTYKRQAQALTGRRQ